jgi:ABC-2 type transport system ATP-binding protein
MMDLIRDLSIRRKMTVMLSSHLLHQAQRICHRLGIMISGHLVAEGTMEKLAAEKLGVGKEAYTLEEIYLKYFKES